MFNSACYTSAPRNTILLPLTMQMVWHLSGSKDDQTASSSLGLRRLCASGLIYITLHYDCKCQSWTERAASQCNASTTVKLLAWSFTCYGNRSFTSVDGRNGGEDAPGAGKVARTARDEGDGEGTPQDGQRALLPEAKHQWRRPSVSAERCSKLPGSDTRPLSCSASFFAAGTSMHGIAACQVHALGIFNHFCSTRIW